MNDPLPVLYVLMRTDMRSQGVGRACAQSNHASSAFVKYMHYDMLETDKGLECESLYNKWAEETPQGFGTTIVLSVDEATMRQYVEEAISAGYHAGIVNDPEYFIKDGDAVHLLSIDTCAWIFDPAKGEGVLRYITVDLELLSEKHFVWEG